MGRYHIIGDKDTVLGFRFAGVEGTVVDDAASAEAAFKSALSDEGISILIITEKVQEFLPDLVMAHKVEARPPFVATIEDIWGPRSRRVSMAETIFAAVGVKIVKDDE